MSFLRQAVVSEPWTHQIISKITTEAKFRELHTELSSTLQVEEFRARHGVQTYGTKSSSSSSNLKPQIYFQRFERVGLDILDMEQIFAENITMYCDHTSMVGSYQ